MEIRNQYQKSHSKLVLHQKKNQITLYNIVGMEIRNSHKQNLKNIQIEKNFQRMEAYNNKIQICLTNSL